MNIGNAMLQLRKEAGIQQNVLAKKIGISASALRAIESEKSLPKVKTVRAFCKVMEIPFGKLILESITIDDFFYDINREDAVDVMDIIGLAKLRVNRSIVRIKGGDLL